MSGALYVEAAVEKLRLLGITLPLGRIRIDGYGDSEALSKELVELIRSGRKRAGTGLLWLHEYEDNPPASPGDIELVVNHKGELSVVTRTLTVTTLPFSEVTADYAATEGEGDGSLSHWREAHWSYFSRECQRIGREPSESMTVICSLFEILHVLPVQTDA